MGYSNYLTHGSTAEESADTQIVHTIATNNVTAGKAFFVAVALDSGNNGSGGSQTSIVSILDSQTNNYTKVGEYKY